jgi:hypothetical protein
MTAPASAQLDGVAARARGKTAAQLLSFMRNPRALRWPLLVLYGLLLGVPLAWVLSAHRFIGYDWSEYAITAQGYLTQQTSLYTYPYPLLPAIYLPTSALGVSAGATLAAVLSALLLLGSVLACYHLLRGLTPNGWAQLAGTASVGTFPLWLHEVGWGGQAQFFAIILGLVALAFTIPFASQPSWKGTAPVAVLLGLAALAEVYAAAFFTMAAIFYIALARGNTMFTLPVILRSIPVLLVPGTIALATTVSNPSVAQAGLSQPLGLVITSPGVLVALLARLGANIPGLELGYLLLVPCYLYLRTRGLIAATRAPKLLPAVAIAGIFETLVLTPQEYPTRGLYFLAIPLCVAMAEIVASIPLGGDPPTSSGNARRSATTMPVRAPERTIASATVVCLLVLALQIGVSPTVYGTSLTYYSYPSSSLNDLSFLRGQNGSIAYMSSQALEFPASWASGRFTWAHPRYP